MRSRFVASLFMALCLATGCDRAAKPDDEPAAAPADAPQAPDQVAGIAAQMEACIGDDAPMATRRCAEEAMDAAEALTAKSAGNAQVNELYRAMFEPIISALTTDSGLGVRYQNAIVRSYAEFAFARAAILTGPARPSRPPQPSPDGFARLSDGKAMAQRWAAIRDADCAAYPVAHCAARLDEAMAAMLNSLAPE